ncbi:MAG: hypothetical protein HY840_16180 [Bacteroidetes bacterium]|nr:hypothetical protein [Bacteroidota bacterium]
MKQKNKISKAKLLILCLVLTTGTVFSQTAQISGFADVIAVASSDTAGGKMQTKNNFSLGAIDMFITSQFDKVSFLGEVAFEWDEVDFERLVINYDIKNYFKISVGKFYTPLGYWNNTYNHGTLIQPTISRPEVLGDFIKSMHLKKQIGFQFQGDGITKYNLGYNLAVTHGITDIGYVDDADEGKALTLNLHAEPIENLKVFVSGLYDVVPKGQQAVSDSILLTDADFQIFNFGVAYMNGKLPFEFIGEYYNVSHNMAETKSTQGYLLYAGYRIKKFVPYISYDVLLYEKGDQYFNTNNSNAATLGLRYLLNAKSVIKLEYKYRQLETTGVGHFVTMQFAIGF